MHNHYSDITERIEERPRWFDENGTPRYSEPSPDDVPDIYADEVAFVRIRCQACGHRTLVAFSMSVMKRFDPFKGTISERTLADAIRDRSLHYGDPPNDHGCSGVTMNCEDEAVELFFAKGKDFDWHRVPELEISLEEPLLQDGPDQT